MSNSNNVDLSLGKILEIVDDPEASLVTPIEPQEPQEPEEPQNIQEPSESEEPQEPQEPQEQQEPIEPVEPTESTESDEPQEPVDNKETAYFEFLKEQGVLDLPEDFEFDGSTESLIEALEITKENLGKRGFQRVMSSLSPEVQQAIAYAVQGGDIKEFLKETKQIDFSKFDLSTQAGQREIIREYYKATTPHNDEKIEKLVDLLAADENDLKVEAEDALNYLKDLEERRKKELLEKQAHLREIERQKTQQYIQETTQIIDNLELPKSRSTKLKAFMFQPIDANGNVSTSFALTLEQIKANPRHLAELANIVMDYDPQKGFNLKGIEIKQRSKIVDDFKRKLDNVPVPSKGTSSRKTSKKMDWNSILNQLK